MNKHTTKAIVLKRVDYADNDRIITVITPSFGKLSLMAKGVRKLNSKLAGGIELFSVFDAGFVIGKGELGRLTSARLIEFYGNIINDINRVQLGYEILRNFDKILEPNPESAYFYLLNEMLALLNQPSLDVAKVRLYYLARMLTLAGYKPNLAKDVNGQALSKDATYNLNVSSMSLTPLGNGKLAANDIKFMRLLFDEDEANQSLRVKLNDGQIRLVSPLLESMFMTYLSL